MIKTSEKKLKAYEIASNHKKVKVFYRAKIGYVEKETILMFAPDNKYLMKSIKELLKEYNCTLAEVYSATDWTFNYTLEKVIHIKK